MLALPRLIGHRGAARHAPENTLAGLRTAAAQGATWVEVDVKLTRDGVPILMHDDTLDRTTSGRGPVAQADLATVRALDAGAWFDPAFAGERVPTLAEALELALDLGLGLNLEIKPCPGRARATAQVALALAQRLWPDDRPPPLVSSFDPVSLAEARSVVPDWPRGLLLHGLPPDWAERAERLGVPTLNVNHAALDPERVATLRASGRPLLAYTVNDPVRARRLLSWGVDALFTDTPRDLEPVLGVMP